MIRLHLACGTCYLKGFFNIDIKTGNSFLASERPDLKEQYETDFEHYYKEDVSVDDFKTGKLHYKHVVCDFYADIRELPYAKETVDQMLGVQIFEHFSLSEAHNLLTYWYSLLKQGGELRLYVPDIKGVIDGYSSSGDMEWTIRQIYGSQKNEYGIHKFGYTFDTLKKMFQQHGFKDIEFLPNINNYPAFGIKGVK